MINETVGQKLFAGFIPTNIAKIVGFLGRHTGRHKRSPLIAFDQKSGNFDVT